MPNATPTLVSAPPPVGLARVEQRLGDAEVRDRRPTLGEQDVLRLDVAVYDAVLVRVRERARHVAQRAHHLGHGQLARPQARAQRFALHERHREPGEPVGVAGREEGDDVRMLQPRGERDLALEALHRHAARQLRREHLEDHAPVERRLRGEEDARHPAAAQFAVYAVALAQRLL